MFARIWEFFSFAGRYEDRDDNRKAKLLNAVLLTMGAASLFVLVVVSLIPSPGRVRTLVAMLIFMLVVAGLMTLLRRGYLQLTAVLSLIVLFLGGTLDAAAFGGVRDPGMTFLIVVIALAALLLGGRAAMVVAGFSILAAISVHFTQSNNWLGFTFTPVFESTYDAWIFLSIVFVMAGLVLRSAVNSLNDALARLADANRELENTRASLEERVAARTRDLEQAGEIGRRLAQIRELGELLDEAAHLIQEGFNLASVQIYLVGPARRNLVLRARSGWEAPGMAQVGGRVPIAPGTTIGMAAIDRQPAIAAAVPDPGSYQRRDALAQATEIAIPLVSGAQLTGIIQLYSSLSDRLTRDTMPAFEALASELAIAVENAILFTEVTAARAEVEAQAHRLTRAGWEEFLNAIERSERVGYAYDQEGLTPVTELPPADSTKETATSFITVTGVPVGAIQVMREAGHSWTAGETSLIESVAQRVSQQVENLRLLAEAERYRLEAEQASRRLTREGWVGYIQQAETPAGYLYNQNEVLPLEGAGNGHSEVPPLQHNLVVRGEPIGDLELIQPAGLEPEANELAAAVAQRLSAHIENLRLAEQREKALSDTEDQAQRLVLLNEMGRELSLATNQDEVFKIVASRISDVVGGEDSAIGLLDASGETMRVLQLDKASGVVVQVYEMPIAGSAPGQAMHEQRIILQPDIQLGAYPENELLLGSGIRATLVAPLVIQARTIGMVSVFSRQPGSLDERAQNLMRQVASLLAATLESRRLVEELQGALHKTEALYEASSSLLGSDDLEQMLQGVVDGVVTALGADAVVLLNFDTEQREVTTFLASGPGTTNIVRFSYDVYQEGLSGWVLREKRPALSPKGVADERESPEVQKRRFDNKAGAIIVVPLLYRGEAVGTITAVNREDQRDFTQEDVDLMVALANQATVAIENRRLFAQTQAALNETEVRARYQANIAEAVALLSGYGTQAIADVLRLLGEAAQVSRVYYFETQVDEAGAYWRQVAEWCGPGVTPQINDEALQRLPVEAMPFWAEMLQQEGVFAGLSRTLPAAMQEILQAREALSLVALAVNAPGRPAPGFLGFEETLYEREWSRDEIGALHTAGSALSNTIIREHLFDQVQESLEETENLYQASAALNTAGSYDDVVAAMRDHTILGQNSQNISLNYFDRPWQETALPEWVDVLARWNLLPAETLSERYPLAPFVSMSSLLSAETPALIEDIANDPRLDENVRAFYTGRFGAASTIFVPLVVGGQWFGYFNAIYQQPATFPAADVRQLMALARQAAVAVQSIRLLEETNRLLANETRQRKHADTLVRAAGRMSGVLNEAQIRQIMVDEIYNVLLPDQISLFVWDKETSAFRVESRVLAAPGHDEDHYTVGMMVPAAERPDLWDVFGSNKPLLESQPQANQMLREHYCLPYLVGDDVEGLVELYHTARGATIRPQDQALCENLLQQAALRLQNTRLFWQASERAEEMAAINEVARAVSRQMDQLHLIETIYEQVRRIMPADAFYVGLYNSDTNEVVFPVVFDEGQRFTEGEPHAPRGKTLELIETGQPILQNWTPEEWEARNLDPSTLRIGQESKVSASLMFVPLQIGRRIIGVMSAQSYRFNVYGQRELALLAGIANHVAVAIENADLFQQTQARAEELAILNEMGRDLTGSLDLESVYQNVHHYTSLLMDTANFYIAYYDAETDEVSFPLAYENGKQVPWRSRRLGKGMTEYVVRNRQALFIERNVEGWLAQHGVESIGAVAGTWLGVPLVVGQKVIGIIAVQNERSGIYQERHRELLSAVASQAAIAVENARLFKQTEARAEELAILNEMSRSLSATLNLDDVVDQIHQYTSRLMDTANFYVALYDAEHDEIEFALDVKGDDIHRHVGRRRARLGLTEYLIRTGQPLLMKENVQEQIEALGIEVFGAQAKSWLGVPMGYGQQATGVIAVQSYTTPRLYTEHDRDLLIAIANQAAIVIENARLFKQTEVRAEELTILNEMSRALSATLEVDDVLDRIYEHASRLLDATNFYVSLYYPEQDEIEFALDITGDDITRHRGRRHFANGLTEHLIRTGRPLLISEHVMEEVQRLGLEVINTRAISWLGVPMGYGKQAIGTIAVLSYTTPRLYTEHDRELLTAIASQAAIAIQNARSFESATNARREAEERLRETAALQQLSQSLARTLQVSEILDIFFRASLDVIGGFDYLTISLVDKYQQRVSTVAGVGVTDSQLKRASYSLNSDNIMADIIRTGRTEVIAGWDERLDKALLEVEEQADWVRLFTPLSVRQENIGLVEAGFRQRSKDSIHESQINLLKAFISQTSLALDNAKRYETSQQVARREQILREVTARVRNSADVDTILRTAAQEVSRALGRKSFVYLGNGEAQPFVETTEGS